MRVGKGRFARGVSKLGWRMRKDWRLERFLVVGCRGGITVFSMFAIAMFGGVFH